MTWFETEQIVAYIAEVGRALEDWTLNRVQMKEVQVELIRLRRKLKSEIARHTNAEQNDVLQQILGQLHECRHCINERLKC